jgi:hypothetical protein
MVYERLYYEPTPHGAASFLDLAQPDDRVDGRASFSKVF